MFCAVGCFLTRVHNQYKQVDWLANTAHTNSVLGNVPVTEDPDSPATQYATGAEEQLDSEKLKNKNWARRIFKCKS